MPYVKNPFVYITTNLDDFEGDKGRELKEKFKKIFYKYYKSYSDTVNLYSRKSLDEKYQG